MQARRIEAVGIGKKFCRSLGRSMLYGLADMGQELVGIDVDRRHLRVGEYWALADVDFAVERGECLGVIGHNGAGKSTLLKLVAGVLSPDLGRITIRGRMATLIEIGAGFHPMLSGRENIYLNGAVLGMRRREIDARFDEIVAFAGIEAFLDAPVKHYSSGMYVRLGFSVAVHTRPDLLLVDEALAVGDAAFRVKCLNRIADLKADGVAILFVSHSEIDISRVTDRCLLLNQGRPAVLGDPAAVLQRYRADRLAAGDSAARQRGAATDFAGGVSIVAVVVEGADATPRPVAGGACRIVLSVTSDRARRGVAVELRWWNSDEQLIAVMDRANVSGVVDLEPGLQQICFDVDSLDIMPDRYRLAGGLMHADRIVAWSVELARVDVRASATCPNNGVALLRGSVRVAAETSPTSQASGGIG